MSDLQTFVSQFLAVCVAPVWQLWAGGTILSIPLISWLVRQIVKSIRKLY